MSWKDVSPRVKAVCAIYLATKICGEPISKQRLYEVTGVHPDWLGRSVKKLEKLLEGE